MATATVNPANSNGTTFIPREHGATAMLLTPFFAAAILLRQVYWPELMALFAITCAFAIKDPLVVIARQRFVWKQEHVETKAAKRSAEVQLLLLVGCGIVLVQARGWRPFMPLFLGAGAFTVLAVILNVRNKQRAEWFQVASAVALSATSLVVCLSAKGIVPGWCWLLWLLCSLQAAAGIFVVHARLDARIAARKRQVASNQNRRAAFLCQIVLILAAVCFAILARVWIAAALFIAAICYLAELKPQTVAESLQIPLRRIGSEALGLSIVNALVIIVGLWRG
jgi:hypothetical protein